MSEALNKLIEAVEAGTDAPFADASDECLYLFTQQKINLVQRANGGSLDAALALMTILPGWAINVDILIGRKGPISSDVKLNDDETIFAAQEKSPARAWLLAILRAYRSTQQ